MAAPVAKTVLVVYIHGFQGDDTTFSSFPQHLATSLSTRLASLPQPPTVKSILYPAFETRGALDAAVERFRAWLLEKVIDAEVARGTPSPTLAPGVGVILCGHSMGGIVAADACLGVFAECCADGAFGEDARAAREQAAMTGAENPWADDTHDSAASPAPAAASHASGSSAPQPFPRLLGVLAFDTPYLGISPGVVRFGAEEHYREGKKWYDGASALLGPESTPASLFSRAAGSGGAAASGSGPAVAAAAAESSSKAGGWSWGKAALVAGAGLGAAAAAARPALVAGAGLAAAAAAPRPALVAGAGLGAAAAAAAAGYAGRQYITGGYTWVTEHLAFVGCLAREADLKARVQRMIALSKGNYTADRNSRQGISVGTVGFANLYTLLDPAATKLPDQVSATRTFCRLPATGDDAGGKFLAASNFKAAGEVQAHVTMFLPAENPQYSTLVQMSTGLIGDWVSDWSEKPV